MANNKVRLTKKLTDQIIDHTIKEYPKEACGLVINKEYINKNLDNLVKDTDLSKFIL